MHIDGTIVHHDFEGGFWAIEGDDGTGYLPVDGVPEAYREEGLRVAVEAEAASVMTTVMWGRSIRIRSLRRR